MPVRCSARPHRKVASRDLVLGLRNTGLSYEMEHHLEGTVEADELSQTAKDRTRYHWQCAGKRFRCPNWSW